MTQSCKRNASSRNRTEHRTSCHGAAKLPRRLEGILPARRDAERFQGARRMDPPPAPSNPPKAMEAWHDDLSPTAISGSLRDGRGKGRGQRPPMVEELGEAHQRRLPHQLLRPAGCPPAGLVTSTLRTARCGPARRGGVGGVVRDYLTPLSRLLRDSFRPAES